MKEELGWKKTFKGRRPLMKNKILRKTTFDAKQRLMEDDLSLKTPLMKDDLWLITIFGLEMTSAGRNIK